jgi:two-component sensor histidine kinase
LVEPLRDGLQARVDQRFFREKYDAARMLQRVSHSSAALLDVEKLAAMILAEVSNTMHSERAAIFVKDQAGGYQMVASEGLPSGQVWGLQADNPIVTHVAGHREVFWAGNLESVPLVHALRLEERRRWEELKPELLTPITLKGALVGLLAVGSKLSGLDYSSDDRAMLMTLANQTAVAIENARLYAAVQAELAERQAAEARLLESLHEKEVLLKEIHHRVKNNLQVIYSLLSLQTRRAMDPATLNVLLDSQNRIRSMALIHEKLYQSADLANIDFSEYLKSLAGHLYRSYGETGCRVQLQVSAAQVRLGIDAAVPCGLIASELISNALKHAFVGRESGVLRVAARRSDAGRVELEVADDGVGVPADLDSEGSSTLGMQLIKGLVKQLDATLTVQNGQGARFVVSFVPRPTVGS